MNGFDGGIPSLPGSFSNDINDLDLDSLLNSYLNQIAPEAAQPMQTQAVLAPPSVSQPAPAPSANLGALDALLGGFAAPGGQEGAASGFPNNFFAQMPPLPPLQFVATPGQAAPAFGAQPRNAPAAAAPAAKTTKRGGRGAKAKAPAAITLPSVSAAVPAATTPDSEDDSGDLSCGDSATSQEHRSKKKRQAEADKDMSAAERRHQALQEKNRRAQRRFRERQKAKITELHTQIEELTKKVSVLQTENSTLHSRTSILQKVLDMRNEQIQVMQESKEIGSTLDVDNASMPLTLSAVSGQSVSLTPEVVKELSPEQICRIYQAYANELSSQIVELSKAGPRHAEVLAHIEKLTKEVERLLMRLSVIKPVETKKFVAVSRQYLSSESQAIELWTNVVRTLNLTDQQKKEIVQLKQLYLQKMEPVMEERRKLHVQIQADLPHETFHTRNAITYIKTHEAVARLRDNLRMEQNVTLEFCGAVFRGVLQGLQMAYLLVQSYPVVPDALAVASAITSEYGEQLALPPFRAPSLPHLDAGNGFHMLHLPNMLTSSAPSQSQAPSTQLMHQLVAPPSLSMPAPPAISLAVSAGNLAVSTVNSSQSAGGSEQESGAKSATGPAMGTPSDLPMLSSLMAAVGK